MKTAEITTGNKKSGTPSYVSTTNACKLCKPLGAALAFRGIEGAVSFLHGSQGCATYMRRYLISHYREPMDIASSSLGEKHAVYGGASNLKQGIINVMRKYNPSLIGIATTCLTETIGDDVPMIIRDFRREFQEENGGRELPELVNVSTPSYSGTHMEGFHAAVRATVDNLAGNSEPGAEVNLLPGLVSPADIRYLKEIMDDFAISATILPDISESLDGPAIEDYEKIPEGGTPIPAIRAMGRARGSIEFGGTLFNQATAGSLLAERFAVRLSQIGTPIGLRETDRFFSLLESISGRETPRKHALERGRLVDAYVDGHKYIFGKRAFIYGEEDLVVGLTSLLTEIGVRPVLCGSGGKSGELAEEVKRVTKDFLPEPPATREGVDFFEIAEEAEELRPDIIIGHSKGYRLARKLGIPLVRTGFPIHDRFGGPRIHHLGYRGTQELLDRVVNAVLEKKQADSPVGYGYL
jgi:nitrogenase molybdenum-iron protein NifN